MSTNLLTSVPSSKLFDLLSGPINGINKEKPVINLRGDDTRQHNTLGLEMDEDESPPGRVLTNRKDLSQFIYTVEKMDTPSEDFENDDEDYTPKLQRAGNLEDTEDTLGGDDILNSMSDNEMRC